MNNLEYRYPVDALYTGSSLGNLYSFARLSASTDLLGLWSATDNQYYVGEWAVRILAGGMPLRPVETIFAAAHQTTLLAGEGITAEQSFFLPVFDEDVQEPRANKQRMALFSITLRNSEACEAQVVIRHSITFPAVATDRFTKQPAEPQCAKKVHIHRHGHFCTITTVGRTAESRVFGSDIPWTSFTSDDATLNAEYDVRLQPGGSRGFLFKLAYSPVGTKEALTVFKGAEPGGAIREHSARAIGQVIARAMVFTPNPVINRGLQWAKVNMIRTRHRYRTGEAFTNDPPQDIVVIRDLAWFALGADYLLPQFSRRMLEGAVKLAVHGGGKLTEYYHADERSPVQHDYHLNINDDTPLFVWAIAHHCFVTGDRRLAEALYPVMKHACEWILRQVVEGLVRCQAKGTNVWGICSWRNIIDDYNVSGAVTEINAECFLALSLTADMARRIGKSADAERFANRAAQLREEMNRQLRSELTGMYLLNIDNDGVRHHDITGDLIFPVLAGAADPDMQKRILDRLTAEDMWTEYGARTVSPKEPNFSPEAGYQLVGGVWPNLTAWIAYCLRSSCPEKVEEALVNIYRITETERPAAFGFVVPGEFPERLHGTGFQSRGMTLSPWTPPAYLWLGIEGLLGVRCTWDDIEMNPAMPAGWRWIAAKDLLLKGQRVTAFLHDGTLYASHPLVSRHGVRIGSELRTLSDNAAIFTAGLFIDGECHLFAAASEPAASIVRIEHQGVWIEREAVLARGESTLFQIPPTSNKG